MGKVTEMGVLTAVKVFVMLVVLVSGPERVTAVRGTDGDVIWMR